MKLRDAGLSLDDLNEIILLLSAACDTLEDANGAAPPPTVNELPNPDYERYLRLHKIVQACVIFTGMVIQYDVDNAVVPPTDPAVVMTVQVGAY